MSRSLSAGFTLVELIAVIVIVGIVGAIGDQFAIHAMESYKTTQARSALLQQSRAALDRLSRHVHNAVPHSVVIANAGQCVKFLPMVATGIYSDDLPLLTAEKGMLFLQPLMLSPIQGAPEYVVIAPRAPSDIYSASASAVAGYSTISAGNVYLSSLKKWPYESQTKRFYLSDKPQAFCFSNNELRFYTGLDVVSGDVTTNGNYELLSRSLTLVQPFAVSMATDVRQTLLSYRVETSSQNEAVVIDQQVLIRNVP